MADVSVVVPCYKAERFVEKTIESCFSSIGLDVEVIVVEDGVFDHTSSIVEKLSSKYSGKIKHIVNEINLGAPATRNIGFREANSDYVLFLDSDDYIEGGLLEGLFKSISQSNCSLAFAPCRKEYVSSGKSSVFYPTAGESSYDVVYRWLIGMSGPGTCSVLWRISELERIGAWREDMVRNQDGEVIIRAMLSGCTVTSSMYGFGVYVHRNVSSVSKRRDLEGYRSQKEIVDFVEGRISDNKEQFGYLENALLTFIFNTAVDAYFHGYIEVAESWYELWRRLGGNWKKLPDNTFRMRVKRIIALAFGPKGLSNFTSILRLLRRF
ncbi:hypothetical protein GCM10011348_33080 [Marinobacterium nitratireducens]|uniref:Glycosyltransferase 2-like domain-containing protein n=1 Tax=Marinobacterium nitratireducens TaxID=518897 RepID=A0A918DWN1_9GAMM|nr:glycosyltransferase [Marinobacterium nitratireducens]GGO85163.1 hypothetical protein GCM10011348_33080 [Marinobacterium nitratireducens]